MSISEHLWCTFSINKEPIRETQGDNEINIEGEHNVWARLRLVNPMKPKNLLNAVYQENEQSLWVEMNVLVDWIPNKTIN